MDPVTLAALFSTGTGLAGLLFGGGKKLRQSDVNIPALGQIQSLLDMISQPGFGRDLFLRQAAAARPTVDSVLGAFSAAGGSRAAGLEFQRDIAQQGVSGAFEAQRRFQTGLLGVQGSLLGALSQGQQFQTSLLLGDRNRRQQRRDSLFGGLVNIGTTLGTAQITGLIGSRKAADIGNVQAFSSPRLPAPRGIGQTSPLGQLPFEMPRSAINFINPLDYFEPNRRRN